MKHKDTPWQVASGRQIHELYDSIFKKKKKNGPPPMESDKNDIRLESSFTQQP